MVKIFPYILTEAEVATFKALGALQKGENLRPNSLQQD